MKRYRIVTEGLSSWIEKRVWFLWVPFSLEYDTRFNATVVKTFATRTAAREWLFTHVDDIHPEIVLRTEGYDAG